MSDTYGCYIGVKPCGCIVAAAVDRRDRETAMSVGVFIRDGLTVQHTTVEDARKRLAPCHCPPDSEPAG